MINLNMAKRITLVFIALSFGLLVVAQTNLEDVVYLKNGGLVRGKIIEYFPDKHVKIETLGGNVWVFQSDDV
ncbi:MAG: hypothetical protein ISR55_06320, partial [Bacteroidetes bacterium]|nr:hypothetical protein [Bacteroidota bacterium]